MCVCVCTKRVFVSLKYWSAKQCDWLSHARPAPFLFPLFLFHGFIVVRCQQNVPLSENKVRGKQRRLEWRGLKVRLTLILWEKKTRYIKVMWDEQLSFSFMNHSSGNVQSFLKKMHQTGKQNLQLQCLDLIYWTKNIHEVLDFFRG